MEISGPACEHCERRLYASGFGPLVKKGIVRVVQSDILNYKPQTNPSEMWFNIFLEVFDNLPHDRIYGNLKDTSSIKEVWVERDPEG